MLLDPVAFSEELDSADTSVSLVEKVERLARKFKVSQEVVARRMLDMEPPQINQDDYELIRNYANSLWRMHRKQLDEKRKKLRLEGKPTGPGFYQTKIWQNGISFTRTVLGAYYSGKASAGEVYGLLGLAVRHLPRFSETVGMPMPANWTGR
jgi:Zn-dependent peptidase ImmA (M78 family)